MGEGGGEKKKKKGGNPKTQSKEMLELRRGNLFPIQMVEVTDTGKKRKGEVAGILQIVPKE